MSPCRTGDATNILFAFLNGEAFDYIGSSRMVYDMTEKAFPAKVEDGDFKNGHQPPLELNHIKEIITLGQLYNSASDNLFAHTDTSFSDREMIRELKARFRGTLQDATGDKGLPPSSIQSFLKKSKSIPGVHISDFDQEYTNKFFHGIFDTAKAWLPDGYKQIFRNVCVRPFGLLDYGSAMLRRKI